MYRYDAEGGFVYHDGRILLPLRADIYTTKGGFTPLRADMYATKGGFTPLRADMYATKGGYVGSYTHTGGMYLEREYSL